MNAGVSTSAGEIPTPLLAACLEFPALLQAVFERPGSGLAYFPGHLEGPPWISPRLLTALGGPPGPIRAASLAPDPEDRARIHALTRASSDLATGPFELSVRWRNDARASDPVQILTEGYLLVIRSQTEPVGAVLVCEAASAPKAPVPRPFSPEFHFRSLVESLPLFLWTCDVHGQCDYVSPQWVEYTGVAADAQLGTRWAERVHPDDRAAMKERWEAATKAKCPFELEYRIRGKDERYRWFRSRAHPLVTDEGAILRWLGETSEFQAEREESERLIARLELASVASTHGIWDCDLATNRIHWDPRMYELYEVFEPVFKPTWANWIDRLHPDDRARAPVSPADSASDRPPFGGDFRIRGAQGGYRHLRAKSVVWRDGARPVRLFGVCFDVTAEHDAREALLANQTLLDDFIWHAPAAIAMLDTDMRYIKTSEQWVRDYKLQQTDIIGKSHYEVFPDIPDHWRRAHQRALAGSVESAQEDPFPRADGRVEWLQWEIRPWRRADRTIGGLVFFTQVITARKELDLALEQQRQSLARSNQHLAEFAYAASHDLQEPLRAVSGCAQLLRDRTSHFLDEESQTLIHHLVEGSERLRSLIIDLLSYGRLGSEPATRVKVDLNQVLHEALKNLETSRQEANAMISIESLPTVEGDRALLILFFQNIVGNALKYRKPGVSPKISITSRVRGDEVRIQVQDNGIGIAEQYQTRIFQLFQRLHTREEYSGNGFGLTICSRIADQHGGSIVVSSEVGRGSQFSLVLPNQRGRP